MYSCGQLYHCPICVQNFHSEKGLYRHMISRKHQKRYVDYERYMAWKNAISGTKLTPLPNFVIDALVDDLNSGNGIHKKDFFTDIDLVDVQEFNRSLCDSIQYQHYPYQDQHQRQQYLYQKQRQQKIIDSHTRRFFQPIPIDRNSYGTRISPIYPPNRQSHHIPTPYLYHSNKCSRFS